MARPTYYDHKVKPRASSKSIQKESSLASKPEKQNLNQQLYSCHTPTGRNNTQEFSRIGRVFKRTNSCRSNKGAEQVYLNSQVSANKKNTVKFDNDSDEEMKSFLEAEREAQEAYLKQPMQTIQDHPIWTKEKNF